MLHDDSNSADVTESVISSWQDLIASIERLPAPVSEAGAWPSIDKAAVLALVKEAFGVGTQPLEVFEAREMDAILVRVFPTFSSLSPFGGETLLLSLLHILRFSFPS